MSETRSTNEGSHRGAPWIWLRIVAGFLVCETVSLGLDAWLRFWILPFTGRNDAKRIRAINGAVRVWGSVMFAIVRRAVGLRVEVEGRVPDSGRYLIVANHQSFLDVPLLIATFPALNLKFVAMEELRRGKPAISLVLRHGGFAFVGARNAGEDLAALTRFASDLPRFDGSPAIFPAGGLERGEGPRPFSLAGIEVLRRISRLPILPVAIEGLDGAPSLRDLLRIRGSQVTIRIGEPISAEIADRDPRAALERLEESIYRDVAEIRARTRGDSRAPSPGT